MSADIFRHADKSLLVILNNMSREFQSLGMRLGFDDLNTLEMLRTVNAMYTRIDTVVRREYGKIALAAYMEAGGEREYFDTHEFVSTMLEAYDPVSTFVYSREWARKRDRLFESIIATQTGNQDMRRALKRGLDLMANQVRQYADIATIQARLQAFVDDDVEYVRWVIERDGNVCGVCRDRDGRIYKIDELPAIPAHRNCRCWIIPATEEEYERQQVA